MLLAAVAVFEGYRWLHLIPGGSLRPPGLFVAVACLPATVWLSRCLAPARAGTARVLACSAAAVLPVLGTAALASGSAWWCRALGATSLVLAASLLALAVLSGRRDDADAART